MRRIVFVALCFAWMIWLKPEAHVRDIRTGTDNKTVAIRVDRIDTSEKPFVETETYLGKGKKSVRRLIPWASISYIEEE